MLCVGPQATREKLYEAQTMCADRQATIDERDATIGELEATITALRADIEEKDASIARLEPYVCPQHAALWSLCGCSWLMPCMRTSIAQVRATNARVDRRGAVTSGKAGHGQGMGR